MSSNKTYAYVSSWTSTYGGNEGGGITTFSVDGERGTFTFASHIADEINASYLCISPDNRFLYVINETKCNSEKTGAGGSVTAYMIHPDTGMLEFINEKPTMGVYPCDFDMDKTGKYLLIVNQGSRDKIFTTARNVEGGYALVENRDEASIVMMPIMENGGVGDVCHLVPHTGTSIVPVWQDSAYPHSVNVDYSNRFVVVCERGGDKIVSYSMDRKRNQLDFCDVLAVTPGYGPRNIAFHPVLPYFFMTNEIEPIVTSFSMDPETGKLKEIQCISTVPKDYAPEDPNDFFSCTHPSDVKVHPNGKFLYVCNRGHNSIAFFEICPESGKLVFVNATCCQGDNPRDITFDASGKLLYVVNTGTGSIDRFEVDSESGILTPKDRAAELTRPVCMRFANL